MYVICMELKIIKNTKNRQRHRLSEPSSIFTSVIIVPMVNLSELVHYVLSVHSGLSQSWFTFEVTPGNHKSISVEVQVWLGVVYLCFGRRYHSAYWQKPSICFYFYYKEQHYGMRYLMYLLTAVHTGVEYR